MGLSNQIAIQLKELYFGKSWTAVDYQSQLKDVSLGQALQSVNGLNSIATLLYHTTYYIDAQLSVLRGEELKSSDKESFSFPEMDSEKDWQNMQELTWQKAQALVDFITAMPDAKLSDNFYGDKYGTWHRNLLGLLEHNYYHLGQIVIIKKLIDQK
jgi:uncharacterized damage-inducible protein DinB